ncbi:hypothetical protein [Brevundimonas balnearis]|uniref:Uncharacterized protein n=1 Tax=Brevundimonas balnearis TaxID=1572858 RepID=A0ABV6R110_9CAUL
MIALFSRIPWQWKAAGGVVLAFALLWTAYSYQKARADRAVAQARTSKVTTRALDQVAVEIPIIRSEQEEKQRAVDQIEGSDQRLPDGYGADLQRVRDRQRGGDPR